MAHPTKRVVALLLLFTVPTVLLFTPLANTHTICGGCPWEGGYGVCQYCGYDHPEGSHGTFHPCGKHLTSESGDHTLQASCTSTNDQGRSCTVTSFYACDGHSHVYPTTQAECDEAKEDCKAATKAANDALETAAIVCTVAAVEPTQATKLACTVYYIRAGLKAAYATYVCLKADDICSRVQ